MANFGSPPRFITTVRQFHDGMQARVQNDGVFSEPFEVTNGVKQGCVMAPTLFSMMFSAMLMDAFQDNDTGFPIRYRFDGNISNLRRLLAKTKVRLMCQMSSFMQMIWIRMLAQRAMDQVLQSYDNYDLTISTKRQRLYSNQHLENRTVNQPSL